jgi:undecaprenyl-diphosphatase
MTPLVVGGAALVLALLGLLAMSVDHSVLSWDRPVSSAIRDLDGDWLRSVMRGLTDLGDRVLLLFVLVPMIVVAWFRCRQLAVVLLLAFPAALGLELLFKMLIDRPRPLSGGHLSTSSFPSGHVLAAASVWGLLPPWAYLVTRRAGVWLAAVIVSALVLLGVGVSRVYLGAHWPSDVVAAYLAGSLFLLAAEWAVRRSWSSLRCEACELHPIRELAESHASD